MSRILYTPPEPVEIGKRPHFSEAVRRRVWEREQGICYLCKEKVLPGEAWELEHANQRSVSNDDRESNLFVAHAERAECHPKKTAEDAAVRAHVNRMKKKHDLRREDWPRTSPPIRSRGFRKRWES